MRFIKKRSVVLHFVLSYLICGWLIADQYAFNHLYFNRNIIDLIMMGLLFIIGNILGQYFIKPNALTSFFSQVGLILFAIFYNQLQEFIFISPQLFNGVAYLFISLIGLVSSLAAFPKDLRNNIQLLVLSLLTLLGGLMFTFVDSLEIFFVLVSFDLLLLCLLVSPTKTTFRIASLCLASLLLLLSIAGVIPQPKAFSSQSKFREKVIYSHQTRLQQIDITTWKGHQWYYFDHINQFSSLDEFLYYEPLVHPIMHLTANRTNVLVVGGENGLIARELKKYTSIKQIDIIPYDHELYQIGRENPLFNKLNEHSLQWEKTNLIEEEVFDYLENKNPQYDVVILDLPDPLNADLGKYYSKEFYQLCSAALNGDGFMITQSGSPYYSTKAFKAIELTIQAAGFSTLPLHNQILTGGEWGWVVASKSLETGELEQQTNSLSFEGIETRWLNEEAMKLMTSFGKSYVITDSLEINTLYNHVIVEYYRSGTWRFD
ncbi:MAG: hypothetical protein JXQ96_21545 [Cyclobacteriaceae bacterium]